MQDPVLEEATKTSNGKFIKFIRKVLLMCQNKGAIYKIQSKPDLISKRITCLLN